MNESTVNQIIGEVTEGIYADDPSLLTQYGEAGKQKCREDNHHHFKQLHIAASRKNEQFFIDYALWLNNILTARGMQTDHLVDNLERIERALSRTEALETAEYTSLLRAAIRSLERTKGADHS
ncbi:hypothetical protein [Bacillus thermotolerans]|uniref:hypothetical protein n=1 Tax=Bacillus thermotolerans TaxID=1221996 RepID=UPI0005808433|nr:hypothetical protein [Bacillus thermotolerans]KKB37889.1 hypothetical protein QY97_03794 [Bacillus thermotolerans]